MHEQKKERKRKHSEMETMSMGYPVPQRKPRMSFPKEFDKIRRPRLKGMKRGGFKREMGQMRVSHNLILILIFNLNFLY